jgi:3-dehydroquinate dehydratase-1
MNAIQIRGITLGEGVPKICVSISEKYKEDVLEKGQVIVESSVDIVEWRVDWFEESTVSNITGVLEDLRKVIGEIPLIFTFRNAHEGGEKTLELREYIGLIKVAIKSGLVDIVDVEAFKVGLIDTGYMDEVINLATEHGVKVMASNHDYNSTPSKEMIFSTLRAMRRLGPDLVKIAVMPKRMEDVLNLLSASELFASWEDTVPFIAISMGELGRVSRYCGEGRGLALTFGALGDESGPGQIKVEELKTLLIANHKIGID